MIQSMTGFGKAVVQLPSKKITIEVKSLNSKNLDLNARTPSAFREKELEIRKLLASKLVRGKIDFSLFSETTGEASATKINIPVVEGYMKQLENIVSGDALHHLEMAIKLPDATSTFREEINEGEWKAIETAINGAVSNILEYRADEGIVLEKDFTNRVENIKTLLAKVIKIDPERIESVRARLEKGILELKEKVDENRFEQELVYYIEKFDITEEKVRLQNHLEYFIEALETPESNGKKLGFIAQEMGREINTIGSKSNFAPMQKLVVQMKDELEKIKEQLLNVL